MATKSKASPPNLDLYEKLIATMPELEMKGATMPYTSLNGHMFSYLDPTGTMALRLGDEDREAFLKKYKTTLMISHGAVMKEYVKVPDAMLKEGKKLKKYLALAYAYIKGLKPKTTKKK